MGNTVYPSGYPESTLTENAEVFCSHTTFLYEAGAVSIILR
jgi:hypothetical protein